MDNIDKLTAKHEKAISYLNAIKRFKKRVEMSEEGLKGFPGSFPKLASELRDRIEIQKTCISRLTNYYNKNLK